MSDDIYAGWTLEQLRNEQRKSWNSGMSADYDGKRALDLENALRKLNKPPEVQISRSDLRDLFNARDKVSFEDIVSAKQDPRYWDSGRRDPQYVKEIDFVVQKFGEAKQRQLDAEAEKNRTTLLDRG
jgi:hypothetical protein